MTTVSGILCKGSLESDSELVLEGEILEFMKISRHPNEFPTKKALLDAGRSDLVDAIITKGGWMSLGWDDEDEDEDNDIWDMNARFDSSLTCCSSSHQSASSSGRSVETVIQEDAWLEGILYRLEKHRSLSFGASMQEDGHCIYDSSKVNDSQRVYGSVDVDVTATVPYSVVKSNRHDAMDSNNVKSQLHQMKHELSSSLRLLRFTKDKKTNNLLNDHKSSSSELHRLPDTWEFHENEDFEVKDRLKSVCAELAVLEGKLTSSIIHAQELVKKKQRRINGGCRNLQLRNVCIIWHDSASEVLLAGSVDGWTTQRKMKKSEAGVFHLSLKLYPGRYEYKFIVDGVWRVDLLRPIANKNGYENNVLIIPE
ncbi:hypothetical protein M8C21_019510 [Ambrosia artemisiifolia]|uniref:AMP-activated protein kinase glycogen-binding domain-containing protein n=1 Tax=Ambrosia artemisiifolia TaxID=4212 RepID=A0AAD5BNS3_AMBAR|nr:hypothetical protein M8C21_019510 [Ambrosia artemisiifolia]